ncbi:MAG: SUMF1/EgtB/PvdO family nonheme iron enzyme [Blastocatellia bacterium]
MLGRTIGNYEVVSPFGEGGMGELYLGRHTRLAREVIIKTVRTEDFSPRQIEHLRDRLEREAFVQSQLDHANIVRVYDFVASGDTTCIVMEYVPGRDLRKMISRETGPISPPRAIRLFKQVLNAIEYSHNFIYLDKSNEKHRGIIHRDLKPANILVTPDDLVKVTDFGIVKVRGVKGGTQMGFNPGTPEYMSPEQARGRDLDQRSDIYSLGIVFYEMLTGHVPFEDDGSGTSDYEIRRGHIEMPVPPMTQHYPGISAELEKIVFKALEKNPDDRYQTASQFLEVIEDFEETGMAKITGRMPGARQTILHSDRGTGRQKMAEAPTVGIDETMLTAANAASSTAPPPNAAPKRDGVLFTEPKRNSPGFGRAEAPRSNMPIIVVGFLITMLVAGIAYWLLTRPQPLAGGGGGGIPAGMVSIPESEFMMGRDDASEFEKPAHLVRMYSFYIDRTEVTNERYADFVRQKNRNAPSHWIDETYPPGEANFPVKNVSWYDARDYCEWRGKRLPTEEEWEYAARGKENLLYPYGNAWKAQFSSASTQDQIGKLSAVGSYKEGESPFGLVDMAGNVAEWTATDYKPYPGSPEKQDPGNKVLRGGSFQNLPSEQTATDRRWLPPQSKRDYLGFRCAKDIK